MNQLLDKWKNDVKILKVHPRFRSGYWFKDEQIDQAISILLDFFGSKFFTPEYSKKYNGENPLDGNRNWITYHLSQAETSLGSVLIIFEITCLLDAFNHTERNRKLLDKQFKQNNKAINLKEFRSKYFQLFTGFILQKKGFDIQFEVQDPTLGKKKPIDIIAKSQTKTYLVECMTLNNAEDEMRLLNSVHAYFRLFFDQCEEYRNRPEIIKYLFSSGYLGFKKVDAKSIKQFDAAFDRFILDYIDDLVKCASGQKQVNVPYTLVEDIFTLSVEPFKPGLYDNFSSMLKDFEYSAFFQFTNSQFLAGAQVKATNMGRKVRSALIKKREQHEESGIENKIFFFEIEQYIGLSVPMRIEKADIDMIKEELKDDELLCLIVKDSTREDNLNRTIIVLSHDNSRRIHKIMASLDLNPFIKIN